MSSQNNVVRRAVHGCDPRIRQFPSSGQTRGSHKEQRFRRYQRALFEIIDARATSSSAQHGRSRHDGVVSSAAVPRQSYAANGCEFRFPKQSHCQNEGEFWLSIALSKYFPDAMWSAMPSSRGGRTILRTISFRRRWKRSATDAASGNYRLNPSSSLKAAEAMKGCRGSLRVEYGSFRRWKFECPAGEVRRCLPWDVSPRR